MDLTDVPTLRAFLERHGVSARKGLGQHFLCSKRVVDAIAARLEGYAGALEIGPGPGVLTSALSSRIPHVRALEIDERMVGALAESAPSVEVVRGDALGTNLEDLLLDLPTPRAIVSNLPYYITGPLITRIAEVRAHYSRAVLMMQREVGTRILAPPKNSDRGSLSVYLQIQFEISKVADVPPGSFWPPPKVDSIVLEFMPKETGLSPQDKLAFFRLVRGSFKQPRKTLANNLGAMGFSREAVEAALVAAGLDVRARPADPDLGEWRELFEHLR